MCQIHPDPVAGSNGQEMPEQPPAKEQITVVGRVTRKRVSPSENELISLVEEFKRRFKVYVEMPRSDYDLILSRIPQSKRKSIVASMIELAGYIDEVTDDIEKHS